MRHHRERVLRQGQQALGLGRDRHALVGVQMDHEPRVLARAVHRRMDHIARSIDAVGTVHDDVPLEVHLDQGRRRHLIEIDAEGVDQEVVLGPRDAGRDVGEDQVVPALQRRQPVERREVDADAPLFFADPSPERRDSRKIAVCHGRSSAERLALGGKAVKRSRSANRRLDPGDNDRSGSRSC